MTDKKQRLPFKQDDFKRGICEKKPKGGKSEHFLLNMKKDKKER
jgi:hypothetical protein